MRSNGLIFIIGLLFILLTDTILFIQIKKYLYRKWSIILYWLHSIIFVSAVVTYNLTVPSLNGPEAYQWFGLLIGILFLFYSPKINFILVHALGWICGIFSRKARQFFYILATVIAVVVFCSILYGITIGRHNYKIATTEIAFNNLPPAFNNFKIVQLTDLHLGSHSKNYKGINKLVNEVNSLNPDIILFTGDMVNNFASEMTPWIDQLSRLKAKYGKFAVTGNHDYGDYTRWKTPEKRQENLSQFFSNMKDCGFHMLNNDNIPLSINGDTIYIAGVENWGNPPFTRYGLLSEALHGITDEFIILLSHNPSHWTGEIQQYNIPLTLSGHTHAMQMGIKIGNRKWSPAKYIYPQYDGLYNKEKHYLYVSRGQGYLGFPGRIGLRPEITELILIRR